MEQRNSRKRVSDLHRRWNGFVMAQIGDRMLKSATVGFLLAY